MTPPGGQGMSSQRIRRVLKHLLLKRHPNTSIRVMGAHEHDPVVKKLPAAFVFNTQAIDKPGEHWVCIYITRERIGFFFDSFGRHPRQLNKACWAKLLNSNTRRWICNKQAVQPLDSPNCGYYVCKTLYELGKGHKFSTIVNSLNEQSVKQFKKNVIK